MSNRKSICRCRPVLRKISRFYSTFEDADYDADYDAETHTFWPIARTHCLKLGSGKERPPNLVEIKAEDKSFNDKIRIIIAKAC